MPDPDRPPLTSGRRRVLQILATVHPRPARLSDRSMLDTDGGGLVASQPAHHLADAGLVALTSSDDDRHATLTPAGVRVCQAQGLGFSAPARPDLTKARRTALLTLARWHPQPGRYSNITDPATRRLYWQPADWLATHGYAHIDRPGQEVRLTDAGISLCQEQGLGFSPVTEEEVESGLQQVAADLYRAMNESVSDHLIRLTDGQRAETFAYAAGQVSDDLEAGRQPDLLRAFTDALLIADPTYATDPPEEGPTDRLTEPEVDLFRRYLAEQAGPPGIS
jgi:hypothetical protein